METAEASAEIDEEWEYEYDANEYEVSTCKIA